MTTELAAENDPYLLPVPTSDTPVVLPQWISPGNRHSNGRYGDLLWPFAPLIDSPSTGLLNISWRQCPPELREQVKRIAWSLINGQLRPTQMATRGAASRSRISAIGMMSTCREWMRLARWLSKQGVTDLTACTSSHFATYAAHRAQSLGRTAAERALGQLSDLWSFDQLSRRPLGIPQPPWATEGVDDYLPAEMSEGGENSTEPLDPQVIGPLLVWAIRMVEDFAEDVLAAWAERRRMVEIAATTRTTPDGRAALDTYLLPLVRSGSPLPATRSGSGLHLSRAFVSVTTGASLSQIDWFIQRHQLGPQVKERAEMVPLPVKVVGRIGERPWRERIDFDEASELRRHLGTAAAIACLYLTGMRPQEKGAELRLMHHSAERADSISAGGRGRLRGRQVGGDRSAKRLLRSAHAIPTMLHLTQRRLEWLERLIWRVRHT